MSLAPAIWEKGKSAALQLAVRKERPVGAAVEEGIRGNGPQPGVELGFGPAVRPGVEVATGAGLAVAAGGLIPEQRLSEGDGRRPRFGINRLTTRCGFQK